MAISDGPLSEGPLGAAQGASTVGRRPYPYLIQAGVKLKIKEVRVEVIGAITGGGAKIRVMQANGFNISMTALSLVSGIVYKAENLEVTTAFANQTAFYDTFDLDWEVSRDGGSTWEDAGTSKNPIYVCLANPVYDPNTNPILSAIAMFRTLVHLACSTGVATNADQALTNTWAQLSGRTFKTWDQKELLYYYRKTTTFDENVEQNEATTAVLLKKKTGQCGCWAKMFQEALTINGITKDADSAGSSRYTWARCITNHNTAFFWVQTWEDLPGSDDWFYFESPAFDMRPPPSDGNYGHYDNGVTPRTFKNEDTLKGQNSGADDAPSQKVFNNHQFIKYTDLSPVPAVLYYDPSYGATYADAAAFQTKLNGFGDVWEPYPSASNFQKRRLRFKPLPGSTVVELVHVW
jgi:hypothetical protein